MKNMLLDTIGRLLSRRCLDNPIFIIGTGRSGTSVLLEALGRHPLILSMPGEAPILSYLGDYAAQMKYANNSDYFLSSLKVDLGYLYQMLARVGFECAGGRHYALKVFLHNRYSGDHHYHRKRYWCAKTFPPEIPAKGLLLVYPSSHFIYIIRNGMDVVHSMTRYEGFRDQPFTAHCEAWTKSITNYHFLTTFDRTLEIRYENLQQQPEDVFNNIFELTGIQYSEKPVQYVNSNILHPLGDPTVTSVKTREFFKNRMPSYLSWTKEQRETFKNICGKSMEQMGYEIPF